VAPPTKSTAPQPRQHDQNQFLARAAGPFILGFGLANFLETAMRAHPLNLAIGMRYVHAMDRTA